VPPAARAAGSADFGSVDDQLGLVECGHRRSL